MKKLFFILSLCSFVFCNAQKARLVPISSSSQKINIPTRTIEDRIVTDSLTGYGNSWIDGNDEVSVQHQAITHTFGAGNKPVLFKVHPDGTVTKSYPDVSTIPGHDTLDISGLAGGMVNGNYYVATVAFNVSGAFKGSYLLRSTDHGTTWTTTLISAAYKFPFGRVYKCGSKIFIPFYYASGVDSYAVTLESSDNGITWGNETVIYHGNNTNDFVTETVVKQIPNSTTTLLAFSRMQNGTQPKLSISTDAGATWSLVGTLNGIVDANNSSNGVKWDGPVADTKDEEMFVIWSDRFNKNLVKISVDKNYTSLSEWNNAKRCVITSPLGTVQGTQNEFQGSDIIVNGGIYLHWHDVSVACADPLNADAVTTDLITQKITDKAQFFARTSTSSFTGSTKISFDQIMADTRGGLNYTSRTAWTAPKTATYRFAANIAFGSGDGSANTLSFYVNDVLVSSFSNTESNAPALNVSGAVDLNVGDSCYFKFTAGSGTRTVNAELNPSFSIIETGRVDLFSGSTTITSFSSTTTKMTMNTVSDPYGMLDVNSKDIHIPSDGFYLITGKLPLNSAYTAESRLTFQRVSKVAPYYTELTRVSNNTLGSSLLQFSNIYYLRKGDVVYFDFYPIGGTRTLDNSTQNLFTISRFNQ